MAEDLKAQVSYLKGLAEGLALDEESKEGKLLLQIVDLLDEMAYEIESQKQGMRSCPIYGGPRRGSG